MAGKEFYGQIIVEYGPLPSEEAVKNWLRRAKRVAGDLGSEIRGRELNIEEHIWEGYKKPGN